MLGDTGIKNSQKLVGKLGLGPRLSAADPQNSASQLPLMAGGEEGSCARKVELASRCENLSP